MTKYYINFSSNQQYQNGSLNQGGTQDHMELWTGMTMSTRQSLAPAMKDGVMISFRGGSNITESSSFYIACTFLLLVPSCILSFVIIWCTRRALESRKCGTRRSLKMKRTLSVEADTETDHSEFEWCDPDAFPDKEAGIQNADILPPPWTSASLQGVLHAHGLDTDSWTQDQLDYLAKELSEGKARLGREEKKLLRVVDILIIILVYEPEKLVLQEFARPAYKHIANEEAYTKECTLKSRFKSSEEFKECAARCLDKLGTGTEKLVEIVPDILGMREERRILHSAHPGLTSLMQFYVIEARVATTNDNDLDKLGLLSKTLYVSDYIYKWDKIDSVPCVKKHLRNSWGNTMKRGGQTWLGISHAFVPVLPWTEELILQKLGERHVSGLVSQSEERDLALKVLVRALNEGRVSLAILWGSPPKVACIKDIVSVVVRSPRKASLLVSSYSEDGVPILPSVQRQTTESCWRAAVRLTQTTLGLSAPLFQMDANVLTLFDEVHEQKIWVHITREHIVRGPLMFA